MITIGGFRIDRHEASRPDARRTSAGSMTHRACSEPDRLPWSDVTWAQADEACAAAGKRLCSEEEWQRACAGPGARVFPYGDTYDGAACNGADLTAGPDDAVRPTGSLAGCVGPDGSFDMSGNLEEWTAEEVGIGVFRIRGGSFFNIEPGLTCRFDFKDAAATFRFADLGFRCCAGAP
jgi:formylglycine-generating enzyme required for sulfatase activity